MDNEKTPTQNIDKKLLDDETGKKQEMVKTNTKQQMLALAAALSFSAVVGVSGDVKKILKNKNSTQQKPKPLYQKNVSNEELNKGKNPTFSFFTPKSASAAELSNLEQKKFASNCTKLEIDIKNSDEMPLQPIDEWSELMNLVKKQREANSLTADEKSRMDELKKKEWEAMGKYVSVGTGPNSSEWEKLEETTEEINKLTLVVIERIIEAYALAKGVTSEAIKKEVWVKHPTEDRMVFNKAYFEKLAKETNGKDKNFARLLQTGGIVDELFKRYEMFFRMTDWKAVNPRIHNISLRDQGLKSFLSTIRADKPYEHFTKNWNEVEFSSLGYELSKKLTMNYRMWNLTDIRDLFLDLQIPIPEEWIDSAVVGNVYNSISAHDDFFDNKLNYKAN